MTLERDIERRLVDGVHRRGGLIYKFVSPGHVGVPDRIIIWPGGFTEFVELKRPGGGLSSSQNREHERLKKFGAKVLLLSSYDEVEEYLEKHW